MRTLMTFQTALFLNGDCRYPPGIACVQILSGQVFAGNPGDPLILILIRSSYTGILVNLRNYHTVPVDIKVVDDSCSVCPAFAVTRVQILVCSQIPVQFNRACYRSCR